MIKVLQIGMTDNMGGIENYLINYYRHIDKREVQFDFINIYNNNLCFQDELESMGSRIYKVPNYYRYPFKYLKQLKQIIEDNQYQIIHCNMNSAAMIYPLIGAKLGRAKIIIAHSHNSSSDKGIIKSVLHNINKHLIPFFSNTYFACSKKSGKWFFSNKLIEKSNFYVINNSINPKLYTYKEELRLKKRMELGIKLDDIVIGHVGRFNPQKNHHMLLNIFKEYHANNRNSYLILIGNGPLLNSIKKKVDKLNLTEYVKFLGERNDVNELYNCMDCFILPSLYEGLPLVGIEAQINGLNCLFSSEISTEVKISKNAEFIGLNDDLSLWVSKIRKNDKRITINNADFDIEKSSKKLLEIYKELIKR